MKQLTLLERSSYHLHCPQFGWPSLRGCKTLPSQIAISIHLRVLQALVASQQRPERHLLNVLLCTRGIIFLGTPHRGSGLAR